MERDFDINRDGYSIKCKLYCDSPRDIKSACIYVHGFGGHKDTKAAAYFYETLQAKTKKSAVIVFDLPAHGKDVRKKCTLTECDTYISYVVDYAITALNVEKLYAYATSFGGYLVMKYLHDHNSNPFRKIALRCPAVSMYEIIKNRLVTPENLLLLEKGKDIKAGFDRPLLIDSEYINALKENDIRLWDYMDYADDILIIHGTKDEFIPLEEIKAFAENNIIEQKIIEAADHRFQDLNKMKLAHSMIVDFFIK